MDGCEEKRPCPKKKCGCLGVIIAVISALFLGVLGVILGTIFSVVLLLNIGTLIAVATLLGLAAILLVIYKLCVCKKTCC